VIYASLVCAYDYLRDSFPEGSGSPLFDEPQVAADYLCFCSSTGTDLRPFFVKCRVLSGIWILRWVLLSTVDEDGEQCGFSAKQLDKSYAIMQLLVFTDIGRFTRDDRSQVVYIRLPRSLRQ